MVRKKGFVWLFADFVGKITVFNLNNVPVKLEFYLFTDKIRHESVQMPHIIAQKSEVCPFEVTSCKFALSS